MQDLNDSYAFIVASTLLDWVIRQRDLRRHNKSTPYDRALVFRIASELCNIADESQTKGGLTDSAADYLFSTSMSAIDVLADPCTVPFLKDLLDRESVRSSSNWSFRVRCCLLHFPQ